MDAISKEELEQMPINAGGLESNEARQEKAGTSGEEDWHTTPI